MNRVKWAVSRSHSIILIMVMMMMTRVEVLSAWSFPRSDFASLLPPQPYCLVRSFSKLSPDHCHSFYHLPGPYSTHQHIHHVVIKIQHGLSTPMSSRSQPIPIPIPITTNIFSFVKNFSASAHLLFPPRPAMEGKQLSLKYSMKSRSIWNGLFKRHSPHLHLQDAIF